MADFGIFRGFGSKLFSDKLYAGQLPTQLGLIGSENANKYLLNLYPNAAVAYSLRLLNTSYIGSAIRVRRSSDNTEQNIGFIGENLDTAALTSFCGSGNGFVTTWYDQSGNGRNATQSTAANQPQIVSSGSVINTSGKPSINFDTTDQLVFSGTLTDYANLAAFFVNKHNSTAGSIALTLHDGGQAIYINWLESTSDRTYYGSGFIYTGPSGSANTNRKLMTLYSDSTNGYLQLNNSQIGTRANGSTITGNQYINGFAGSTLKANMNTQELVIYNTNQVSNISGINTNINSFYSIY